MYNIVDDKPFTHVPMVVMVDLSTWVCRHVHLGRPTMVVTFTHASIWQVHLYTETWHRSVFRYLYKLQVYTPIRIAYLYSGYRRVCVQVQGDREQVQVEMMLSGYSIGLYSGTYTNYR